MNEQERQQRREAILAAAKAANTPAHKWTEAQAIAARRRAAKLHRDGSEQR